jgi:hypothetical protein
MAIYTTEPLTTSSITQGNIDVQQARIRYFAVCTCAVECSSYTRAGFTWLDRPWYRAEDCGVVLIEDFVGYIDEEHAAYKVAYAVGSMTVAR